ncbi:MAG: response regulator [Tannerella sp.]|nr:response regulator [Tannerella sp.]
MKQNLIPAPVKAILPTTVSSGSLSTQTSGRLSAHTFGSLAFPAMRRLLLLMAIFLIPESGMAEYKFRTFSPKDGLLYDGIFDICQDGDGFIWMMMEAELFRFDGYDYKSYHRNFAAIKPDVEWQFLDMTVDGEGRIVAGTNYGLYRYDKNHGVFVFLAEGNAVQTVFDGRGILWKYDSAWQMFDEAGGKWFSPATKGNAAPPQNTVSCHDGTDFYLFGRSGDIYRYNYSDSMFEYRASLPRAGQVRYAAVRDGKMWVHASPNILYRIDMTTFTVDAETDLFKYTGKNTLRSFHIDRNGKIWIGTLKGVYVYSPDAGEVVHYAHSPSNPYALPNNSVWTIDEDRQKNIWIGTYSGHICYVNLDEEDAFENYGREEGRLNYSPVSSFVEDENSVWIGTEGGGVNRMDKKSGRFSYLLHDENDSNSLTFNSVKSLVLDSADNLWIATYKGGIDRYHVPTRTFRHYRLKSDGLDDSSIRKIVAESDSGLWVAYQNRNMRLSLLSFGDNTFRHVDLPDSSNTDASYIFDIYRDGGDKLWALSSERLYAVDAKTFEAVNIAFPEDRYMKFRTLCMDGSSNLWIGTEENGLVRYNTLTGQFTVFRHILKRGVVSIFSIYSDGDSCLWLGTNSGLVRYNTRDSAFLRYNSSDGIQGQVSYPLAMMRAGDGKIYYGLTNGFTVIDPGRIKVNSHLPEAFISDFFIDYRPAVPPYGDDGKTVVLRHDQSNFGFRFSSDNYLMPEKNMFRYRLLGYHDEWVEANVSNPVVQYSKTPPGTYRFEIVAINNDGISSDRITSVKIVRKPAPWLSLPAYLLYLALAIAVMSFIMRYYRERKKLKLQLCLDGMEKNKQEEIRQAQMLFFTNISHDFKTPISLIMATADKLRQNGLTEKHYRILMNNSRRLLGLVDEVMLMRTIDNGKFKFDAQPTALNEHVRDIAADFSEYGEQRNIRFTVEFDDAIPSPLRVDRRVVEKILMNLLNNSFRFTGDGGRIRVRTLAEHRHFTPQYATGMEIVAPTAPSADRFFLMVVDDSGIGIAGEELSKVFERFYKSNLQGGGTGIGLSLVKSLVTACGGGLSIWSDGGRGTEIAVRLPFSDAAEDAAAEEAAEAAEAAAGDAAEACKNDVQLKKSLQQDVDPKLLHNVSKRILLVEDNADMRRFIADALSGEYKVIQAGDGVEASELLRKTVADLVISDIMMPRKDGITLSREIKTDLRTSHIPVILLTAKTGMDSKIEGADSGADVYVEKPVDFELLKLTVRNIFSHRQTVRDYYARNYFADSGELSSNELDNRFLTDLVAVIDRHITDSRLDVHTIAAGMSMSRSKLYRKMKALTGKSIVEFILNHRLRKAARLLIEKQMPIQDVMCSVGIESQAYFTRAFKEAFGDTPLVFVSKHRKT